MQISEQLYFQSYSLVIFLCVLTEIKVLYDGDCPLCMQEMKVVRYLNDKRRTLDLVNIASPDYKPEDNNGISYETAMGVMHVIGPDGQVSL